MELLTGVLVVCRERPRIDALWHVTKLIDEHAEGCNSLEEAVWRNNTRLMARVIHATDTDSTLNDEDKLNAFAGALSTAALLGNLRVVEQLYAHQPSSLHCETAWVASRTSDLPLLKWIKANNPGLFNSVEKETAFYVAAERGYMETVQWLVSAFPDTFWPLMGPPEVTKWLQDEHVNLDVMRYPWTQTMESNQKLVDDQREDLIKKYTKSKAKLTELRPRKRTREEAGIVDG